MSGPVSGPLRILFVIRDLGWGGAQRQLSILAAELVRRGHKISIAYWSGPNVRQSELASLGVELWPLSRPSRASTFGLVRQLRRLIRDFQPDVCHGYMPVENILCWAARRIRPSTALVWGVRASALSGPGVSIPIAGLFRLQQLLSHVPDMVIANSAAGAELVPDAKRNGKVRIIPNGISAQYLGVDRSDCDELSIRLSEIGAEKVVGVVGRLNPMKGIETFLEALSGLIARRPTVRGLIVGDGEASYVSKLKRKAESVGLSGKILWLPSRDDIGGVYASMNVLASTSLYGEGFSNVVAEALTIGLSVVCTDVGDAREVIGPHGLIVPPGSVPELLAALEAALAAGTVAETHGRTARMKERFSTTLLGDRTEQALLSVVGDRAKSLLA